jgi:hypothetical protein
VNSRDEDFNVRLGHIRDRVGGKSFVDQVLRAARKAGHDCSYAAGRRRYGRSTFGEAALRSAAAGSLRVIAASS